MHAEKTSFRHAVEGLASEATCRPARGTGTTAANIAVCFSHRPNRAKAEPLLSLTSAKCIYHRTPQRIALDALAYLAKRAIRQRRRAIEHFSKIGYSGPNDLELQLRQPIASSAGRRRSASRIEAASIHSRTPVQRTDAWLASPSVFFPMVGGAESTGDGSTTACQSQTQNIFIYLGPHEASFNSEPPPRIGMKSFLVESVIDRRCRSGVTACKRDLTIWGTQRELTDGTTQSLRSQ